MSVRCGGEPRRGPRVPLQACGEARAAGRASARSRRPSKRRRARALAPGRGVASRAAPGENVIISPSDLIDEIMRTSSYRGIPTSPSTSGGMFNDET